MRSGSRIKPLITSLPWVHFRRDKTTMCCGVPICGTQVSPGHEGRTQAQRSWNVLRCFARRDAATLRQL
jgi:hypothetical protein